ncbi:Protein C2-DOMAIN ABA-RELATED 4 [Linum grandiflorum]
MDQEMLGLLRLRIRTGKNLIVRDLGSGTSDPYVIVTLGTQASNLSYHYPFCFFISLCHKWLQSFLYHFDLGVWLISVVWCFLMQKLKTKTVKNNCNPEWNEELTLSIKNPDLPILLTVYDKDTISTDDKMGSVNIHLKPYVDALKIGAKNLPNGCCIKIVQPTEQNCLADESRITWHDGKLLQDMVLKLQHVNSGELDVQIEWIDVPGCKGLVSRDAEFDLI